jgi:hypothetical protein
MQTDLEKKPVDPADQFVQKIVQHKLLSNYHSMQSCFFRIFKDRQARDPLDISRSNSPAPRNEDLSGFRASLQVIAFQD